MVAIPPPDPVTTQDGELVEPPTVPAPEQLHTPPVGPLNVRLLPLHTAPDPEIVAGNGFTVTVVLAVQPVPIE